MRKLHFKSRLLIFVFFFTSIFTQNVSAQIDRIERERAKDMLKTLVKKIEKEYFDPNLRGIDLKAKEQVALKRIDQAKTLGQAFGIIAQIFLDFNDSHLTFYPPSRAAKFDYGWRAMMIGDACFVNMVKPKSNAHKNGLKAGDQLISVNGFRPTRKEFWKMQYFYYTLSPQMKMKLVVKSPNSTPREVLIDTKITKTKRRVDLTNSNDFSEYIQ